MEKLTLDNQECQIELRINGSYWQKLACFGGLHREPDIKQCDYKFVAFEELDQDLVSQYLDGLLKHNFGLNYINMRDREFGSSFVVPTNRIKFFGFCTLARYCWERPQAILEWDRLRKFMPEDTAYLLCSLSSGRGHVYGGHEFIPGFARLRTLVDYNLTDSFIKPSEGISLEDNYEALFNSTTTPPWFAGEKTFDPCRPSNQFRFTPEIYQEYMRPEVNLERVKQLIPKLKYEAVSFGNIP